MWMFILGLVLGLLLMFAAAILVWRLFWWKMGLTDENLKQLLFR